MLEAIQLEAWTTSGTTAHFSPTLTGTETSQVQRRSYTHTHITRNTPLITLICFLSLDNGEGTCVAMTSGQTGGFWDDKECLEKFAFICEKPRPDITPPTKAPTPPPSQGCAEGWTAQPHFRNCFKVFKAVNKTS